MFLPRLKSTERAAFVATAMHFAALSGSMSLNASRHLAYVAREANIKLDGSLIYDDTETLEAIRSDLAKGVFVTELVAFSYMAELSEDVHLSFIRSLEHRFALAPDILEHVDAWARQCHSMWRAGQHMIDAFTDADSLRVDAVALAETPPFAFEIPSDENTENDESFADALSVTVGDNLRVSEDGLDSLEDREMQVHDISVHDIDDAHKDRKGEGDTSQFDELISKDEPTSDLELGSTSDPLAPNALNSDSILDSEDVSQQLLSLEAISPRQFVESEPLCDDSNRLAGLASQEPEDTSDTTENKAPGNKAPDRDLYVENPLLSEIEDEPLGLLQEDDFIEAKPV